MNQKITFKKWLANFFKGIWQALCWIGRAFNPKHKTTFWRVVWAAITICIVTVTCILAHSYYIYNLRHDYRDTETQRISANLAFVKKSGDKTGFIKNFHTGEAVTKDIEWIALPTDEDSLVVFSRKDKRGYLNRFSGEIAIPAKYPKAWVFSSGVASVAEGDSVYFIDHSGKPVSGKKFMFNPKTRAYVYHGDYCAIATENGKMGLIDKSGEWAVEPTYDWICPEANNFWKARKGDCETGLWYALNDKAEIVTETGYPQMEITEDPGIVVTLPNHLQVAYDFNGEKSDQFLCRDLEKMYYDKDEWDEEGNKIIDATTLMRYRMSDGYEGLCTVDGVIITEPIYWEVMPITKDTYLCKYKDASAGVIVNSKGEIVQHQNL